jgi:hypothetical protein
LKTVYIYNRRREERRGRRVAVTKRVGDQRVMIVMMRIIMGCLGSSLALSRVELQPLGEDFWLLLDLK